MQEDNFRFAVLGLVRSRENGVHGYQLKGELEAFCNDFWEVNYGRLYRVLDMLDKTGDLEGHTQLQQGRPNRRVYRITAQGSQALDDWLLQPVSMEPRPLRDELALKLLFLSPANLESVYEQIKRQRSIYIGKLARIARWKQRMKKLDLDVSVTSLVLDGTEMRVRADLAWLDHITRKMLHRLMSSRPQPDERTGNDRSPRS